MISLIFCVLCIYMFYKMMSVVFKATGGILKVGLILLASPLIIGAFIVSGFAVLIVIMLALAGFICLLGLL